MFRKILLHVTLSLLVYLATGSSEELFLEEETKMMTNNEVLSDKMAKIGGEAMIMNITETETANYYENRDYLFKTKRSADVREKLSKAHSNSLNVGEDNTAESTTNDSNVTDNKLWKDTTTKVIEADIVNTSSNAENVSKASIDFVEHLMPLNDTFNLMQLSTDSEQYITTDATTEREIKSTEIVSEVPDTMNSNSNEVNGSQLSGIVDILSMTKETVKTLGPNEPNSNIFSSTGAAMKTNKSETKLAKAEFSTKRSEIDIISKQDVTTDIGIIEAREIESGGTTEISEQENLISQPTESPSQNVNYAPVLDSTADFITARSSKTDTITSQTPIEATTESVPLTSSETISTSSSNILDTSEIDDSNANKAVENKAELENPTPNLNNSLVSERRKNNEKEINLVQTTTTRSTAMNNLVTTASTKLPTQNSSTPKQTVLSLAWYTNLVPLYPAYLLNPFNYFYNATNRTHSGPNVQPTTWNYTTLLNPPTFNFTNLLSQILLPNVTPTARHGFFRQTQSNTTLFNFFPLFRVFNATHHFNKTNFATNTQPATATNITDVLNALLQRKNAKFQQRQTVQNNDNNDGALFVRRQWYTPLVSDNLERSEGVPFLTPVVRYRNEDQQLLTPVITYIERGEPYRIERPHYYRERPKVVKRPTTNHRQQQYYSERPYNIERPYQVEQPTYYNQPVKTDVKVQSGPISYESLPMDLSYIEPIIDIDDGEVEYYYRSKQLNATTLKSAEDTAKQEATTSLMLEVQMPNPIYKFMKSIYNLFMPNN